MSVSSANGQDPVRPHLCLHTVDVYYGLVQAIHQVTFEVPRGKIVTLVGSNGAGKTTILRTISGLVRAAKGSIELDGESIQNLPPHEIVGRRLCHAPEGRGIFLNLSVEENLDLGAWAAPDKSRYQDNLAHAFDLFPRLKERRRQNAGTLSGGELQMLAIGRALMGQPEILLLDEPSLGLAPQVIEKIFDIVQMINREGMTVLLVEQNALQALEIAHWGLVIETGHIVLSGSAESLRKSDEVRRAYLGES